MSWRLKSTTAVEQENCGLTRLALATQVLRIHSPKVCGGLRAYGRFRLLLAHKLPKCGRIKNRYARSAKSSQVHPIEAAR